MPDEVIVEILTTRIPHTQMGRRLQLAHQTVAAIRQGQLHRHVRPDIPRWNAGPTCEQCIHWAGACDLDFPDPAEEGMGFAAWCASFHPEEAAA